MLSTRMHALAARLRAGARASGLAARIGQARAERSAVAVASPTRS
jgi:hypothetical protein